MLRKKSPEELCNSQEVIQALTQVKDQNWPFIALETKFKLGFYLFTHCSELKKGLFPRDFPEISQDSSLYPEKMDNDILICFRKKIMDGSLKALDPLFHINRGTHIFSSVLRYTYTSSTNNTVSDINSHSGQLCKPKPHSAAANNHSQTQVNSCWWIRESSFFDATGLDIGSTDLTPDSIMQVNNTIFMNPFVLIFISIHTGNLEALQRASINQTLHHWRSQSPCPNFKHLLFSTP
jgi:hypothetical protein